MNKIKIEYYIDATSTNGFWYIQIKFSYRLHVVLVNPLMSELPNKNYTKVFPGIWKFSI